MTALTGCSNVAKGDLPYFEIPWHFFQTKEDKIVKEEGVLPTLVGLPLVSINDELNVQAGLSYREGFEALLKDKDFYTNSLMDSEAFERSLGNTFGNGDVTSSSKNVMSLLEEIYKEKHAAIDSLHFIEMGHFVLNKESYTAYGYELYVVNDNAEYVVHPLQVLFNDSGYLVTIESTGKPYDSLYRTRELTADAYVGQNMHAKFNAALAKVNKEFKNEILYEAIQGDGEASELQVFLGGLDATIAPKEIYQDLFIASRGNLESGEISAIRVNDVDAKAITAYDISFATMDGVKTYTFTFDRVTETVLAIGWAIP